MQPHIQRPKGKHAWGTLSVCLSGIQYYYFVQPLNACSKSAAIGLCLKIKNLAQPYSYC